MDPAEPEEITALRRSIHQMIQREFPRERVQAWDTQGSITREEGHRISKMLADLGLYGLCIPEEYGGSGWHVRALGVAEVELVKCSMVLSTILCMGSLWGALLVADTGTEAQKQKLLPGLLAGETLFSFAMTEPDVGGDLASVTTRAERKGDKIVINGRKRFITGAAISDYMYTLVRTGPREDRHKNLSLVIIPTQTAGISIDPIRTMGCHGVPTNEVTFDNVEVSADYLVGGEAGWNTAWSVLAGPVLDIEKLSPITTALGVAEAVLEEAWDYSQQRVQGGKRICGHQTVRHVLSQAQADIQACRLMLSYATALIENREPSALATSMAKLFVCEKARDIVINCQQYVMGAYGYVEGFTTERRVRDILIAPIAGGSTAIQRNNIANLMKLPRE